jgi:allantoate deiminase
MRDCHREITRWVQPSGAETRIDAVGNFHAFYPGTDPELPRLLVGSHLDTVPDAGAFDGILGVVLGVALLDMLQGRRLPFGIEVVGFSEEEGVRFAAPFIGSRALIGQIDDQLLERKDASGISVRTAIENFGLNPASLCDACLKGNILGYIEFHIEQGPVLEDLGLPLAAVEAIAGQSRLEVAFVGRANHAGTTPMRLRRDAGAAAAEWVSAVEQKAIRAPGLVATVGSVQLKPGAANVVAGEARLTLDVRHRSDDIRLPAVADVIRLAQQIATTRRLSVEHRLLLSQPSVKMNARLIDCVEESIRRAGCEPYRMVSGAGHDAMVLGEKIPAAMMFLRTPGGISHHPDETVQQEDVEKALEAAMKLLDMIASSTALQDFTINHA